MPVDVCLFFELYMVSETDGALFRMDPMPLAAQRDGWVGG